jgi:hypothetical protein
VNPLADKSGYRFKGHESFILREGWLNKGLVAVDADSRVFSENFGADTLGVGPNMAKAIRYWLRCAGLTEDAAKTGVVLTELGKTILQHDPYIEDSFTLWLIHCEIARNERQATAWNLYFNRFPYEEFEKERLYEEMKNMAAQLILAVKPADSSVLSDCDAILHMYNPREEKETNPEEKNVSPFGKLGLLRKVNGVYERRQPDLKRLPTDIVWYLLAGCHPGRDAVSLEELLTEPNGPGKLLQLRRTALIEVLEQLERQEKIIFNRTAGLNMIYLNEHPTAQEIVRSYYE